MIHFFESSIITTKDGLHCQVYGNSHPTNSILVKPKYIPTDKIESPILPYRFISGKKMNRLNLWKDKEGLKVYIEQFKQAYPEYVYQSEIHDKERLFFSIPIEQIERIYFPKRGLKELMKMPKESLDKHLLLVYQLIEFFKGGGLTVEDMGVTYSTLLGNYFEVSDINIVVYGKEKYWKLMKFLEVSQHPLLKWKTEEEWLRLYKERNRANIFEKELFLERMKKKKSEGFFGNSLFVVFCAENEDELWFKWGEEEYRALGSAIVRGKVKDNISSVVRPGCYELESSVVVKGKQVNISKIVFYSRDYAMLAYPKETIEASGILEEVKPKKGKEYYRLVVGYLDAYLDERREKEYIKLI